jgi:hypothetical protein
MLQKRKQPKRKSIAATLMRDMQGTAGQTLALFEKLEDAEEFDGEDRQSLSR